MTTAGDNDVAGITALGNDVTEVTVDGDVVWQADTGGDDNVIEDFESDDLDATYSGSTGDFTRVTSPVYEGSYAVEVDAAESAYNWIFRDDEVFGPGETLSMWVYPDGPDTSFYVGFGVPPGTTSDSFEGYELAVYDGNADLVVWENGNGSFGGWNNGAVPTGEWLELQLEWATDGTITFTFYDTTGSEVNSGSYSDTTFTSAGGIGWDGSSSVLTYYDYVTLVE